MKPLRCFFTPAADLDVQAIAEFYASEGGEEVVLRFLLALDKATDFIRKNPDAGSPRYFRNRRLDGLRSWPVSGFDDIRLYYLRPQEDTLRLIRILHGRRYVARILAKET